MIKYCGECGADLRDTNGVCPNCANKNSCNGVINRVNIKKNAKELLDKHFWKIFKVCLFEFILMALSMFLIDRFIDSKSILYDYATLFRTFIFLPLTVGLTNYIIKVVRDDDVAFDDIFVFYDKRIFSVFAVGFLISLFTVLWSLLFVIPGIIAALSYSMWTYVIVDNDNMSVMQVINESKRLTDGYKGDIFIFGLSFIGWYMLSTITMGIGFIYVIPYVTVSSAMYYEELKKIKK